MVNVPRGRQASAPTDIPPRGWWDIARRIFDKLGKQNVSVLSAGVAFYAMLAIFPALGAIVTLYALISDPADVQEHVNALQRILPGDVSGIFNDQLTVLAAKETGGLSVGLIVGVLFAVWSAHRGVDAIVRAITVAYNEPETRNIFKMNLLTYTLTLAAVLLVVFVLFLLVGLPTVIALLPTPQWIDLTTTMFRWLIMLAVVVVFMAVLYRFAPPRRPAAWRWLSAGAIVATILWILSSAALSFYVSQFDAYNETYGTLGAIVVLLMWFYLSSYSIILGASLNAEMEYQTVKDTTKGMNRPMGERGAVVADSVPDAPP